VQGETPYAILSQSSRNPLRTRIYGLCPHRLKSEKRTFQVLVVVRRASLALLLPCHHVLPLLVRTQLRVLRVRENVRTVHTQLGGDMASACIVWVPRVDVAIIHRPCTAA